MVHDPLRLAEIRLVKTTRVYMNVVKSYMNSYFFFMKKYFHRKKIFKNYQLPVQHTIFIF